MIDLNELADRYVALWNERDPNQRRRAIVRDAGNVFRSCGNADGHHGLMKFNWTMNAADTGTLVAKGAYVLVVEEPGRIRAAYFFNDPIATRA